MGNSILLEIKEWMESLGLSPASIFLMACFVVIFLILIFVLFALLLRKPSLWYWKINTQLETLRRIDSKLNQVEEAVCGRKGDQTEFSSEEEPEEQTNMEACQVRQAREQIDMESGNKPVRNNNDSFIGKSGTVYTEEELELQIRD